MTNKMYAVFGTLKGEEKEFLIHNFLLFDENEASTIGDKWLKDNENSHSYRLQDMKVPE